MPSIRGMSTDTTTEPAFPDFGPGDRIRLIRRKVLHIRQGELAAKIDVDPGVLSAWESGRNEGGITPAVAKRLEISTGIRGLAAYVLLGQPLPTRPFGPGGGDGGSSGVTRRSQRTLIAA